MIRVATRMASMLRRTARVAAGQPRATLWALLVLTCALIAVGLAALAVTHVDRWAANRPGRGASMVVYLSDTVGDPQARALVSRLTSLPGVERAELVASDETARRLQRSLGDDTALLAGVDALGLPTSIEVTLAPGVRDVVAMSPTVTSLRGTPGVDDVVIEHHADAAPVSLGTVRAIAWTAAALFGGLALLVVLATIRVRLEPSRQDRAVAHLLGADPSFLAVPVAVAGALQSAIAAVIAVAVIAGGVHFYGADIASALATALGPVDIQFPPFKELALFVAGAGAVGLVGGALAGGSGSVPQVAHAG